MDKHNYMDLGEDDLFHALRDPGTILSMGSSNLGGVTGVSASKEPKTMQETQERWIQSVGWEDPGTGNGNMLQYSFLRISWAEESGRLQSIELHRVGRD